MLTAERTHGFRESWGCYTDLCQGEVVQAGILGALGFREGFL